LQEAARAHPDVSAFAHELGRLSRATDAGGKEGRNKK
jgi:hypothetical protein